MACSGMLQYYLVSEIKITMIWISVGLWKKKISKLTYLDFFTLFVQTTTDIELNCTEEF